MDSRPQALTRGHGIGRSAASYFVDSQDWVGITCAGNLGVPLAVFVYWVLYTCVESYIVLFRPVVLFLVQLYVKAIGLCFRYKVTCGSSCSVGDALYVWGSFTVVFIYYIGVVYLC